MFFLTFLYGFDFCVHEIIDYFLFSAERGLLGLEARWAGPGHPHLQPAAPDSLQVINKFQPVFCAAQTLYRSHNIGIIFYLRLRSGNALHYSMQDPSFYPHRFSSAKKVNDENNRIWIH